MNMTNTALAETTAVVHPASSLRPTWGNHAVQFYETDDFLADVVAEFVAEGLRARDPVILIATRTHLESIWWRLEARDVDLEAALDHRQIELFDSDEMLRLITVNGVPNVDAFMSNVGAAVRTMRSRHGNRPLRAFGEMVDVLCKRGNSEGATRLEELWNDLAKKESMTLLCGYALDNFRTEEETSTFESVCKGHSHVLLTESFRGLDEASRMREIGRLELRARTLENEVGRRAALDLALREREDALRDFIENGLDGIQWVSQDGRVLFTNNAQLELLGYSADEYVDRHIREIVADPLVLDSMLARLSRGETLRDVEARLRCKDGSTRDVLVHASVYWRDGTFVHSRWFMRDITDRKRAEEQLREQSRINAELLEIARRAEGSARIERERLRQLFMQSPAVIFILRGPNYVYDFVNVAAAKLLGGSQVVGKPLCEVFPDFPPERRAILDRVFITGERHVEDGVRSALDWTRDVRPVERVFNMVFEPYRDARGSVEGIMCFGFDVTEQVVAQKKIEAAAVQLERANRSKDEFLATLSHELRTPLNAILGWTRMLRSGALSPEKMAQALETIERNATVQTQLVEDLLDVSRIVAGKLRMEVRSVDLSSVVENAIEAVRPTATAKGVVLKTFLHGRGAVLGDPDRLQQVLWNLLTNAVRFTPSGGTVNASLYVEGGWARMVVSDTGQGIPSEFLPYVFDRFRQADGTPSRAHGGLGLGLAIARSIVELHGGTVEVDSVGLGRGATFTVRLPGTHKPSSSFKAVSRFPPSEVVERAELDGIHVLVLDDERDARELVAEMLIVSIKAKVSLSSNVNDAIRSVREGRPDVIISDIGMPGEDGYDLIRKLRALSAAEGGNTPAVALTAYARVEDRTKALVAGFNMHLPKPVQRTELLAVLSNLKLMFSKAHC